MGQWHPFVSWIGHRVREAAIHVDRLSQNPSLPRVIFSVDESDRWDSSGLRGYAIAAELQKLGWRTSIFPKQLELSQRQRLIRLERPDVIVLQKGRHPLNRPRYYPNTICVFDVDDADFLYAPLREGTIDCMVNSAGVVAGSKFVADFARRYNSRVDVIWTGSTPTKHKRVRKIWPPVVAFGVSDASFYSAETELVVSALSRVRRNDWQFWLFGVKDPAFGQHTIKTLQDRGIGCRTFPFMKYHKFLKTIEMASIGLAPLVPSNAAHIAGKSFGKVLSYLNGRAVTIASDYVDYPLFFQNGLNGYLASSAEEFADRIELLLSDGELREKITERAYRDYVEKLSTSAAAVRMDRFIRKLMKSRR
jgi:NAD(P)-dependent dehydrogenase (short-subunit alcohol dehydrogenase family)